MDEEKGDIIAFLPESKFQLTREEALELRKFFYQNGYISYEFFPKVIEIVEKLDKFFGE